MAMTADEAYAEAERRIEKAGREGSKRLDLGNLETLIELPSLQGLSELQTISLSRSSVTDISFLGHLPNL